MITFKVFLTEIFDNPYPYKKESISDRSHLYHFYSPNDRYQLGIFNRKPDKNGKVVAGTAFNAKSSEDKGSSEITKLERGSSHKVFTTVHHIIKSHIHDHPEIHQLEFTAQGESRNRLYKHMLRKMSHKHLEKDVGNGMTQYNINKEDIKE